MDFESKKLKSAAELAMEKAEAMEKKPEEKPDDSGEAVKKQHAETEMMKIKSAEDDLKKLREWEKKFGIKIPDTIEKKRTRIEEIK